MERKCRSPKVGMSVVTLRPRGWNGRKEGTWWLQRKERQTGLDHLGYLKARLRKPPSDPRVRGSVVGFENTKVVRLRKDKQNQWLGSSTAVTVE